MEVNPVRPLPAIAAVATLVTALCVVSLRGQRAAAAATSVELHGFVHDMFGAGVPAATVTVADSDTPGDVLARSPTDGEGAFHLSRVPLRHSYRVRAHANGTSVAQCDVERVDLPLRLRVFDAVAVQGVLQNRRGRPVADTTVFAHPLVQGAGDVQARTDADGTFVLRQLPRGLVRVGAVVPGEGMHTLSAVLTGDTTCRLEPPSRPPIDLRLQIIGLPAGHAAPLRVALAPRQFLPGFHAVRAWEHAQLDTGGFAALRDLPDMPFRLEVRIPGATLTPPRVDTQQGSAMVFMATPAEAATTTICVLDENDHPRRDLPLELRVDAATVPVRAKTGTTGEAVFVTSTSVPRGRVHVLDDSCTLVGIARNTRDLPWQVIELGTHNELRGLPACTVRGRVLRADGSAAIGIEVALVGTTGEAQRRSSLDERTCTDTEGRYHFRGLPGVAEPVYAEVRWPFGSVRCQPFALGPECTAPELRLQAMATLRGTVRTRAGEPAAGVRVTMRAWDLKQQCERGGSMIEVVSDGLGRYCFADVAPDGVFVQLLTDEIASSGRATEPFALAPGSTRDLDLQLPQ